MQGLRSSTEGTPQQLKRELEKEGQQSERANEKDQLRGSARLWTPKHRKALVISMGSYCKSLFILFFLVDSYLQFTTIQLN